MDQTIVTISQRPDKLAAITDLSDAWPEFMLHDVCGTLLYDLLADKYADYCIMLLTNTEPEEVLGRAYSVPICWSGNIESGVVPAGWTEVLMIAASDQLLGRQPNMVCAMEITVRRSDRRRGLAKLLIEALRNNARRLGFDTLVAPVRPMLKHEYPTVQMSEYLAWHNEDGLSFDPWIRLHQRVGGRVIGIAPRSMTIAGSISDWEEWTGQRFTKTGPNIVSEALTPVYSDPNSDWAVYVEPNVWVLHAL